MLARPTIPRRSSENPCILRFWLAASNTIVRHEALFPMSEKLNNAMVHQSPESVRRSVTSYFSYYCQRLLWYVVVPGTINCNSKNKSTYRMSHQHLHKKRRQPSWELATLYLKMLWWYHT
jgi:hypothetical protein